MALSCKSWDVALFSLELGFTFLQLDKSNSGKINTPAQLGVPVKYLCITRSTQQAE